MAIVLAENYWQQLKHIQDNQSKELTKIVTPESGFFEIDLNSREITPPVEFKDFFAIEREHFAETIYFEVDRYFDDVDLTMTNIIVEYVNADGLARIFPAVLIDYQTNPGHLRFGWTVGSDATINAGTLTFSVRFYSVDPEKQIFTYSLSTVPYQTKILEGLRDKEGNQINALEGYDFESNVMAGLIQQINDNRMRWINL